MAKSDIVEVKWGLTILLFLILSFKALGQQDSFVFKGQAIDAETKEGIGFATVLLTNKNKGTATDNKGDFIIQVETGDILRLSSVGYHAQVIIITAEFKESKEAIPIFLLPKTYELDSVEVIQMSDNFYLKKRVWDTLTINNPYLGANPRDWGKTNVLPNTNGLAGVTITGFLNSFDKDLQQKKYLQRFAEAEKFKTERKAALEKKFNKTFVKAITGIDDRVIEEFMEFCDFRDGVILRSTKYELTVLILEKYKQFLMR
jgi:hypothetical protein